VFAYRFINKVFHSIDILLNNKNLLKEDKQVLKKRLIRDYIKFKGTYKSLKNVRSTPPKKQLSQKSIVQVNNNVLNKKEQESKPTYMLSSYSVKLYSDYNFKSFAAWMKQ
jgi:TATA-binding protein-associated factor Taf7